MFKKNLIKIKTIKKRMRVITKNKDSYSQKIAWSCESKTFLSY